MSPRTVVPLGPQHPVLPEPLQLKLVLEDEKVVEAVPAIGYIHRGIEKAAEKNDFHQNVFLVERICGICSFMHAVCYCQGIEKMMGIEVTPRAKYLRTIWSELHRLHSHHLWLGLMADSFGFENLFMAFWQNRELIMNIMEKTTGSRVVISACNIGGVRRDLNEEQIIEMRKTLDDVEKHLNMIFKIILNNYTVKKRTVGIGLLSREKALILGALGPVARGSGIPQDLRTTGYAAYKDLNFEPVVETAGDCYARTMVRARETLQSINIIRKALDKLPDGEISVPVKGFPKGKIISRAEQPRGEVVYFIKANGTKNLDRLRVRTPTYSNIPTVLEMLPGCQFANVPVIVLSIDPCISCAER